jgi:hypothetical protein
VDLSVVVNMVVGNSVEYMAGMMAATVEEYWVVECMVVLLMGSMGYVTVVYRVVTVAGLK